ncbi:hypothetical protein KA005_70810 [bacterium]|nr:hypothetical protein [bacterium]
MNLNYYIHGSNIKCPYCDKDCEDYDHEVAQDLETRVELECEHCGKKFYAEASIAYSTYSNCELNGESHDYEQSVSHPTVFDCKNCFHYEVRSN